MKLSTMVLENGRFLQENSTLVTATDDPCNASSTSTTMLSFRIGSIFIILVCACIGVLFTLQTKYFTIFQLSPYAICFFKSIGSGILLACSLVHLLQPASQSLTSPCLPIAFNTTYQAYAFMYCMLTFLMMQTLENFLGYAQVRKIFIISFDIFLIKEQILYSHIDILSHIIHTIYCTKHDTCENTIYQVDIDIHSDFILVITCLYISIYLHVCTKILMFIIHLLYNEYIYMHSVIVQLLQPLLRFRLQIRMILK